MITRWERADLLAFLCVVFSCVFVTFPFGVPGKVWYLIVCFLIFAFLFTLKKYLNQSRFFVFVKFVVMLYAPVNIFFSHVGVLSCLLGLIF